MIKINIIILLALCLTLLLLTVSVVNAIIHKTTSGNFEIQENTEEPVMWSVLGMDVFSLSDKVRELSPYFSNWIDDLLANGFNDIHTDVISDGATQDIAISKSAIDIAVAKGANVIWGFSKYLPLTAANWPTHRQAILDAAQWAQDNGVYEFIIGNEEDAHNDDTTMTDAEVRTLMRGVATDVQAIFTSGNITYSTAVAGTRETY